MISYLKGKILHIENYIILDIGGVGYKLYVPNPVLSQLNKGSEEEFFVHTNVSENDISLFGFTENTDLKMFNSLISINGIGPKVAINILSLPSNEIAAAILGEDIASLTQISGVGKKMAERMILELKNKIPDTISSGGAVSSANTFEAIDALVNLGFNQASAKDMLDGAPADASTEDLIKYGLSKVQ
jgi:Holliday junction DNA helicase RuvA